MAAPCNWGTLGACTLPNELLGPVASGYLVSKLKERYLTWCRGPARSRLPLSRVRRGRDTSQVNGKCPHQGSGSPKTLREKRRGEGCWRES